MKRYIIAIAAFVAVIVLCICFLPGAIQVLNEDNTPLPAETPVAVEDKKQPALAAKASDELRVHYIDVGQGDSEFIELPNGKTMLIDAGESDKGQVVTRYIKSFGYKKIDIVIATHPHSDHMGGMSEVIKNFDIGKIYMPKATNNTVAYENLLTAISDKGLKIKTAKAGVSVLKEENLTIDIIAPIKTYENLNNTSAVIMLKYRDVKFLFMGDAEKESEGDITSNVECDVIKVGHHGSDSSSTASFVKETKARYAVISVGEGNDYGHPKQKILDRWKNSGAQVFRTDKSGTVVITTGGKDIVVTELHAVYVLTGDKTVYVLNTRTKKVHRKDCPRVADIKAANYAETTESIEELISQGYKACEDCTPDRK